MARNPQPNRPAPRETVDPDTGEVTTDGPQTGGAIVHAFGGAGADIGVQIVRHIAVPMLTTTEAPVGVPITCKFVDAMRELPPIEGHRSKYPTAFHGSTIVSPSGDARIFPWSAVFKNEMERAYPNETYVGKWFRITRLLKTGKSYWTFAIQELRVPAHIDAVASAAAGAPAEAA